MTALVVQDRYGGEIEYTQVEEGPHFYNRIMGLRYNFTHEQFSRPLEYQDLPCSRAFVFTDCTQAQYLFLKERFEVVAKAMNER